MKNKLDDLVNCLFCQLERFDNDEICNNPQSTKMELEKANAVANLAGRIIEANRMQLDCIKTAVKYKINAKSLPTNFGVNVKRIESDDTSEDDDDEMDLRY
ncbi:MAG: hypothetical protein NC489_29130 [Ruminococcus flavefaciens]|nr:hypothetical protein [Ruminococcus flavefaciens]